MSNEKPADGLDYSRRLYDIILAWYKNADSKAQILLALDGAFLAFLADSIFIEPDELSKIVSHFKIDAWLFLALMCLSLAGSIVSALICLWSRIFLSGSQDKILKNAKIKLKKSETYPPEVVLFFKTISWLDHKKFQDQLVTIDREFEIRALASQIFLLSERILKKHLWVNFGFILAGFSLICFLAVGISYFVRIQVSFNT